MSPANQSPLSLQPETAQVFLGRPGAARAFAHLVLPDEASLALPNLGTLVLRFACLDGETTAALVKEAASFCEALPLSGMGAGLLLVERHFARHLVNATLGRPPSPMAAPLSRVEHGILGGVCAASLAKLGLSAGVHIAATDADAIGPDVIGVQISADLGGEKGQAWLCTAAASVELCWKTSRRWGGAETTRLRLELARTDLAKTEALAASEGDTVVFEETSALSPLSSWPVQVCYGAKRMDAKLAPDGRVLMDDQTSATSRIRRRISSRSLADPVEITAEIAHRVAAEADLTRTDSLLGSRGDGILLRIGDTDWAEGSLADVDGRLAVLITRKSSG
jgi:hypothetical protein